MGFSKKIVESLPADEYFEFEVSYEKNSRYWNYDGMVDTNPGDPSNDIIYLGEYYVYLDSDGDGVAELELLQHIAHVLAEGVDVSA